MSKGLEALRHPRIKSARVDISAEGKHDIAYMHFDDTKQYAAIEKELKDYYALKKECDEAKWYQEHKAFEIIKEKKVNVSLLLHTKDYYDYNDHVVRAQIYLQSNAECLTQEEWSFLKEVLL